MEIAKNKAPDMIKASVFSLRNVAAIAISTALAWGAAWQYKEVHSGERTSINPAHQTLDVTDQNIRVISWNVHDKASELSTEIADIVKEKAPDALLLQEVGADDLDDLHRALPSQYINYVNADVKDNLLSGGLGNAIITGQKLKSVRTTKIEGTSFVESLGGSILGLAGDVANADTTLDRAKDGTQANRAIIAGNIEYFDGRKNQTLRVVTGHLSGDKTVKDRQFDDFLDFLKEDTKKGRPTIACLDANRTSSQLIIQANDIGYLTGLVDGPTSEGKRSAIDHCVYSGVEKIGLDETSILHMRGSDHDAVDQQFSLGVTKELSPNT